MNCIAEGIQDQALACGFDKCGIIPISALDGFNRLYQKRLADVPMSQYFYTGVKGLNKTQERFPWAKSIVILVFDYGKFRFPKELLDAAADFFPVGGEGDDGVFPVAVRLVAADQAVVLHLAEDRRKRCRIDQTAVGDLPLKRVRVAHQVVDHLRLAGQHRRIFLPKPGEKPFLKQRMRRQEVVVQRVFHEFFIISILII